MKKRILIVEDEMSILQLLTLVMNREGYEVHTCQSGRDAIAMMKQIHPHLILLDVMLPGMDGFAVCAKIREESNTPILIVSAKTEKDDKLAGLLAGADDYIEKPYDIDIMLAKIAGIFKRRYAQDELVSGDLRLNKESRTVHKGEQEISVTAKEFELLLCLAENQGKVLNKDYLFREIWGSDSFSEQQTLTVHIKWLREKIEEDPKHPARIQTVWGVGYKFV